MTDPLRVVTTGELADLLKVSRSAVENLVADGMPALDLDGNVRFVLVDVVSWLRSRVGCVPRRCVPESQPVPVARVELTRKAVRR